MFSRSCVLHGLVTIGITVRITIIIVLVITY